MGLAVIGGEQVSLFGVEVLEVFVAKFLCYFGEYVEVFLNEELVT